MTISAEFIEQIVQNVMRGMQSPATTPGDSALVVTDTGTLTISSRVVTEPVLIAAKAAGRAIALHPGAVITPSGRDFIRRNSVRLSSRISGADGTVTTGTLISVGTNSTADSAGSAAGWKTLTASTEFAAAAAAADNLSRGIVTCCGGEPSVVACLLNRNPAMRAAVITPATDLLTLMSLMRPQIVCVASSGWSFGELLKLLRALAVSSVAPAATWIELSDGGAR